jgi:hypothetical protein
MMKNITLSADEEAIRKVRTYAREHHTTLNQLVRDYFAALIRRMPNRDALAAELDQLVKQYACHPDEGLKLDREQIHRRGGQGG